MLTPYQRLSQILKPNSKEVYQVYVFALIKGLIALSLPLGIQSIINLIQGGSISTSWIVLSALIAFAIGFNGYLQLFQMRIMENIQQQIFARAAFDFTYRLPRIKMESIQQYYPPELMNRFFEILTIQKTLSKIIIDLSTAALQIVFGLILLSIYHPFFVVFSILLVLMVIAIVKLTAKKSLQTSLKESKYKYKVVSWLEELARARDSFKLSGATSLPINKTDARVVEYLNAREEHYGLLKVQYKLLLTFKITVALGLLIVGGILVINQKMNIGQFVASEIIILMIIDSCEKIIVNLENVYDLFTSAEKMSQITDLELDTETHARADQFLDDQNPLEVELNGISFQYPGSEANILHDIHYTFLAGKKYCISGSNGSGKSTLLHLISGVYPPTSGTVCINGLPISNYQKEKLYTHVGNGLKEETVFESSFYENITLGRDEITSEMVDKVIDNLFLREVVKQLPSGLQTVLDPLGSKLPGSVIQKIILARTLIIKPKLILLEQYMDAISENERNKIIDFIVQDRSCTLIAISSNPYLRSSCEFQLEIRNGVLK
jgi:ABC-type bacteriocin/lantibiotic exporter with double-glycine peptidase domain